jgi:hypothetical protein
VGGVADLGERNPEAPNGRETHTDLLDDVWVYSINFLTIISNNMFLTTTIRNIPTVSEKDVKMDLMYTKTKCIYFNLQS